MKINKYFLTYIKIQREKNKKSSKILYQISDDYHKKETSLFVDFMGLFSFDERDQHIADKLILKRADPLIPVKCKTLEINRDNNKFSYDLIGEVDNINIQISIKNKNIWGWSYLANLLENTLFYYFLFDIDFSLREKEDGFLFINYEVDRIVQYVDLKTLYKNNEMGLKCGIFKLVNDTYWTTERTIDTFKQRIK